VSARAAKQLVSEALKGVGLPAPFMELALLPLRQPGRLLCDERPSRWVHLIEACCSASSGRQEFVPRISAAFEVCIAALDVLDEIQDGDQSPLVENIGVARALNITTALLNLAYVILSQNEGQFPDWDLGVSMSQLLAETVISATVGQDQDLAAADSDDVTVDDAIGIARRKSGSLVGGACCMGARLGTRDTELLAEYRDFGVHFGTMSQIANDMHEVQASGVTSDLQRNKATLPLVFLRNSIRSNPNAHTNLTVQTSGALHFAWTVFESEMLSCKRALERLETREQNVEPLQTLLDD